MNAEKLLYIYTIDVSVSTMEMLKGLIGWNYLVDYIVGCYCVRFF